VKTPIKLNNKNKNDVKKEKESQNYNIKEEKIENCDDFDFVLPKNKKPSFSEQIKKDNNKFEKYQKEKESLGYNSVISLTDSNVSIITKIESNEMPNDKDKSPPHIFLKRMIQKDKLIYSLDRNIIYKMEYLMKQYLTNLSRDVNSEKIEEKLNKIYNSLQKLRTCKETYVVLCLDLNALRKIIFQIWKLMNNQLISINLAIKIKSYSYEMYANLRDGIFKSGKVYKEIMENINKTLIDLTEKVNLFENERNNITKALAAIKHFLNDDKEFTKICNLIEKKLGIDFNNYYP
jgi:hypothetical protein